MLQDKQPPGIVANVAINCDLFNKLIILSKYTLDNWIDSGINEIKCINLIEELDRKPRFAKGKEC